MFQIISQKSGRNVAFAIAISVGAPVGAGHAEDWIDPCNGYQAYVAAGGGESGPALALQRVCGVVGARRISQACLLYYTRQTSEWPAYSEAALAPVAQACEASMPGELGIVAESDLPNLPEDDGCGADMVECIVPDDADITEPVDDGPDAAPGGVGGANVMPDGAPAPVDDAALDLAFWNSVRDSGNPVLYQAYLDQFPDGVFAAIAREMLAQSADQSDSGTPGAGATDPGDPDAGADPDGRAAFARAESIMDAAYEQDVSQWDAAARRAWPLYQAAADKGLAEAWLALGDLHEMGIGTSTDNAAALAAFRHAGALGLMEGYERALYLQDQLGDDTGFVEDFTAYFRQAPSAALALLDGVESARIMALQAYLRIKGYYLGGLDGVFGPASQSALEGFVNGAPTPVAPVATPPVAQPAATGSDPLAADIQRELARLGCYLGPIDGKWGPATVQAMENYNSWSGDNGATDAPSEFALKLVTIALGPICGVD